MMYRDGKGTAKDCELAIKWMVAAANQKYAAAQTGVGDLYNSGTCVPQDYARAAKVYELAANQNDASAAAHLGDLYADGHGVKHDPEAAYKWFAIAKAGGAASDQQEKLRNQLSPEQLASAEAAADVWIKEHQKK